MAKVLVLQLSIYVTSDVYFIHVLFFFFKAIKNAPGCMEPLGSRILPSIHSILEKVSFFSLFSTFSLTT